MENVAHPFHWPSIANFNAGYFAMVMATGIVSIACDRLEMTSIARLLFWLNVPVYILLLGLLAARLVAYRQQFLADLIDHRRGVGFFTTVAASSVLGNQFMQIGGMPFVAALLWCVAVVLGFLLTYTLFTCFAVKAQKPTLAEGIDGGWLLAVVSAQSISVLGTALAPGFAGRTEHMLLFALSMWLAGGMLYIWIIGLIFYRCAFFPISPDDLVPTYWITMGAMAISTRSGVSLISAAHDSALLGELVPFVKGFTILFWATATWWIPMLVILGAWRHVYKRYRLTYDPQYWGAVFPLGMYTVCTFEMAHVFDLPYLYFIPQVSVYVSLIAWVLVLAGLIYSAGRAVLR